MTAKKVLIVDDEADICELIEITLMRMGITSQSALNLMQAKQLLQTEHFDLCLTDMHLPDGNGIEFVEHVQIHHNDVPIAVITAHGNMESAVKALKAGAFDFVSKPVDIQILRNLVSAATNIPEKNDNRKDDKNKINITGNSDAVQALLKNIAKLARNQAPVFIHGESGSGKERVARMIHQQGSRTNQPFVPVNCGAISSELMESEFFGHLKGSFTGAHSDKQGLFEAANGGTLFLDEIAELPLNMQVKLLRVIQEKAIRPVGSAQEKSVDVRILSASHKNLVKLVADGTFREDLYYRINVIELAIPSLRERKEDIPLFIDQLLNNLAKKTGVKVPVIDAEAITALQDYPFPGNVRELENILERAIALSDNSVITTQDLHLKSVANHQLTNDEDLTFTPPPVNPMDLIGQERQSIKQALEQTRWNKTAAAKLLGLSLRQLRYRLQKLDIK
ncbi:MAG: sigma-54-dependent Fis family transcriptional regulator [Gammaproteobacteria bacterium]|nr:MAG: sigma-54-dependent Fis family transcriptional regulator [Gammaproteobacteria bacterium]